ncbi:hypothetical protein ZWY2020_027302 [Hordeum vulgare]|nr:hypothetical protein ZWY2020_027302 [Hordeum vulgare]
MLMAVLPRLMRYEGGHRTEECQWDEFVPAGLVESIVAGAAGGGSYACHVWMHVNLTSVYDEARALLLSCEAAEAATDAAARRASDGGAATCPICMEELSGGASPGWPAARTPSTEAASSSGSAPRRRARPAGVT